VKIDLTPEETHRLKIFENAALKKLSGPKKVEVTGEM
jgi:hypothetical protein